MTDTGTAAAVKGIRDGTRPLVKLPSHTYKKKHQDNKGACDDVQKSWVCHFLPDRKYKVQHQSQGLEVEVD